MQMLSLSTTRRENNGIEGFEEPDALMQEPIHRPPLPATTEQASGWTQANTFEGFEEEREARARVCESAPPPSSTHTHSSSIELNPFHLH